MFDINKRKILFDSLSYEGKRVRILSMLEIIKEDWNIFDELYNILSEKNVEQDVLYEIHITILEAIYQIDVEKMEESLSNLEKLSNSLSEIKEKEKKDDMKEEPDMLLNHL